MEENFPKLILRFYQKNFEDPIDFDCANEEDLLKEEKVPVEIVAPFRSPKRWSQGKRRRRKSQIRRDRCQFERRFVIQIDVQFDAFKSVVKGGGVAAVQVRLRVRPGDYFRCRFIFGRGALQAVRDHHAKRVSKYSKPKEAGKKKAVQNVAVSSKTPIVAKRNICDFNRSKKSLREFFANKTGFKKFNTSRSKACNNLKASTTVKRQPNFKHFQSPFSKQSSNQED